MLEDLMRRDGLLHSLPPEKLAQLQGEVLTLFQASPRHARTTVTGFAFAVLPPIHYNQFRIYRQGDKPIAWVSWAEMSGADAAGYMGGDFTFSPETWQSGPHLWFIDFIAPYGHALAVAEDLKRNVFPDRVAYAPDIDWETGARRIRQFHGVNAKGRDKVPDEARFLTALTTPPVT